MDLTDPAWWHGIVELEPLGDGGVRAWRYPHRDPRFDIGIMYGGTPAGVRLGFHTTATRLTLDLVVDLEDPSPVDIVVDGEHLARRSITEPVTVDLGPDTKLVEIWLPQYGCAGIRSLTLDDDAPTPVAPHPIRWTTHGSSITMNKQADGPYGTWPVRAATALGWELTSFGFASTALFDPPVARLIRDRPADVISLCLGINVLHTDTFNRRSLVPAVIGFLDTIREGQPDTPLLVISPIAARPARDVPNVLGLSVSGIREAVHEGVQKVLAATGDRNLHLLDGRELLGPDDLDLLVDDLHPGDAGCAHIAARIAPILDDLVSRPH